MTSTTSITIGGLAWAFDRLAPRGWQHRRDLAVGAVYQAEDVAARLAGRVREQASAAVADAAQRLRDLRDDLADVGAYEARLGEQRAAAALDRVAVAVAGAVATSPAVNRVVDVQLDRTVRPLLITVLDEVLRTLEADPDRLRPVVRAQRESIVDDLLDRIRTGAEAGDDATERLTARILRRPEPASVWHPDPAAE